MTLSFSPPISFGQRAMPFCVGMPSAEVGPVSEMLTPIVRSASAGNGASAAKAAAAAAARMRFFFMACLLGWALK